MFASIQQKKLAFTCFTLCCLVAFSQTVSAQQYESRAPKVKGSKARQLGSKAKAAFRDTTNYQANKQAIDQYFSQVYFPNMTSYSSEALGGLAKKREGLIRIIRGTKVPAAQKQLTALAFKASQGISRGNYHPAVRYNAVLILGALDEKQATNAAPPKPLPVATDSLLELLEKDAFNEVKVSSSLKLGALVGLERHAHCGVSEEYTQKLTQACLNVISQEEPPADISSDVFNWMKCQAVRVLTRLHAQKPNPEVQVALTKMINDSNLSLEDRCCVAALLFRINYKDAEGVEVTSTVDALGNLMKQVAADEAEKAREYEQTKIGGRVGVLRNRIDPIYQRGRLASRLWSIGRAGSSLMAGVSEEDKAKISSLLSTLGPVMAIAADKDNVDLNVTAAVKNLESEISAVVDSWGQPADAAEADEDFS